MTLAEKLSKIQQEMKAPKNLYNSFGKYNYRNAESILEAFKPFEEIYKVMMILEDDILIVGDRVYVKATATIYDLESDNHAFQTTAFAREPEQKKGMDESQVTGTASSYARKYALNALFLLDDTKDADTDEYQRQTGSDAPQSRNVELASQKQLNMIKSLCKAKNVSLSKWLEQLGKTEADITKTDASRMIGQLNKVNENGCQSNS